MSAKNPVISTNDYGHGYRESFIGVACFDEDRMIKIYMSCLVYPKTHELRDYMATLTKEHGENIPADVLQQFVHDFSYATVDTRDNKRFVVNRKSKPTDAVDVATLVFGNPPVTSARIVFSNMLAPGLKVSSIFFNGLFQLSAQALSDYPVAVASIRQAQQDHLVKYPIKFINDFSNEEMTIGYTE